MFCAIELFAGAGGLALGIEKAGFETLGLIEFDKDAADTLKKTDLIGMSFMMILPIFLVWIWKNIPPVRLDALRASNPLPTFAKSALTRSLRLLTHPHFAHLGEGC